MANVKTADKQTHKQTGQKQFAPQIRSGGYEKFYKHCPRNSACVPTSIESLPSDTVVSSSGSVVSSPGNPGGCLALWCAKEVESLSFFSSRKSCARAIKFVLWHEMLCLGRILFVLQHEMFVLEHDLVLPLAQNIHAQAKNKSCLSKIVCARAER